MPNDGAPPPRYAVSVKINVVRVYPPMGPGQQPHVEGTLAAEETAEGLEAAVAYKTCMERLGPILKATKCEDSGLVLLKPVN